MLDRADAAQCGEGGFTLEPVGVVAGSDQQLGGTDRADPRAGQQPGDDLTDDQVDVLVVVADLGVQVLPATGQGTEGDAGAVGADQGGAGIGELDDASAVDLDALGVGQLQDEAAQLLLGLGAGLDALRRATSKARSCPAGPARRLGVAVASPASTARAAASASTGSDLPRRRRATRLGRLTSNTVTPEPVRNRASR
jgi:hypothetical protein